MNIYTDNSKSVLEFLSIFLSLQKYITYFSMDNYLVLLDMKPSFKLLKLNCFKIITRALRSWLLVSTRLSERKSHVEIYIKLSKRNGIFINKTVDSTYCFL